MRVIIFLMIYAIVVISICVVYAVLGFKGVPQQRLKPLVLLLPLAVAALAIGLFSETINWLYAISILVGAFVSFEISKFLAGKQRPYHTESAGSPSETGDGFVYLGAREDFLRHWHE